MGKVIRAVLSTTGFLCLIAIPCFAADAPSADVAGESSDKFHGYEAVVGVTSRAQALLVFEDRGDRKLAVMTGKFVPTPMVFVNTPFRPFAEENLGRGKMSRSGYYWKFSYNKFSLDRQEDPDTGGIGPASPIYNYGTRVEGEFMAVAPVFANETIRPDGTVPFRIEVGMGLGYMDFSGDIVLGDWEGDPMAPVADIDYNGLSWFLFTMGRHQWKGFMFGYQMGISYADSSPYDFSQSYVALDFGYRVEF